MAHEKKATGKKKKSVYILYQLLYVIQKKRGKKETTEALWAKRNQIRCPQKIKCTNKYTSFV